MNQARPSKRGFTLLEVLVALVVLSVALLAGTRANEAMLFNTDHYQKQMAAHWCVNNALVEVRLLGQLPDVGKRAVVCEQGPYQFAIQTSVWTTPNPNFRRVVSQASLKNEVLATISTVVGQY